MLPLAYDSDISKLLDKVIFIGELQALAGLPESNRSDARAENRSISFARKELQRLADQCISDVSSTTEFSKLLDKIFSVGGARAKLHALALQCFDINDSGKRAEFFKLLDTIISIGEARADLRDLHSRCTSTSDDGKRPTPFELSDIITSIAEAYTKRHVSVDQCFGTEDEEVFFI